MCTPPAAQALLVRNSSKTHQRCETTPESRDCLASGFVLQREGSERAPIAGGSIQTRRKAAVCALRSFQKVAFRCWVFWSRGAASASPTKPPCTARDGAMQVERV